MKLVVIVCAGSKLEEVRRLVDEHEVHGYTEIPEAHGSGATGRKMGSRAWPGTSSMIFTAVEDSKADELVEALQAFSRTCSPEEGIRVMVLPVERFV
jgi:nitrogen regulatory protein PII